MRNLHNATLLVSFKIGLLVLTPEIRADSLTNQVILNDTGINECSSSTGVITCGSAQYPGQDAEHFSNRLNNGFSFTKLDIYGRSLLDNVTNHACVLDNATGLTWEVKTNDAGLRDWHWLYTWYNTKAPNYPGTPSGGTCYTNGRCDTEKYIEDINTQGLCGFNDWRLPTLQELLGIVHYANAHNPAIDVNFFPNTWPMGLLPGNGDESLRLYWSATQYYNNLDNAWIVDMQDGGTQTTPIHFSYHSIRLVRGQLATSDFHAHDNGTVTDYATGLTWGRCTVGQTDSGCISGTPTGMTWGEALLVAKASRLGGYNDWRLPNIKELQSLMAYYDHAVNLEGDPLDFPFPNTPWHEQNWYWSSSTLVTDPKYAWGVNFLHGNVDSNEDTEKVRDYYTRLVRGGTHYVAFGINIIKDGNGLGRVTTDPAGVNCGEDCDGGFKIGTTVKLIATPDAGSVLTAWGGDADCQDSQLNMNVDKNCQVTFTLKAKQAPTAITELPSTITTAGAKINGTVTPNGAATTVTFNFGLTTSYNTTLAASPDHIPPGVAATAVNAELTGLLCNTVYHYRVVASNSIGTTKGIDQNFTTAPCPPGVPMPLSITNPATGITATGATLNGIVDDNGSPTTVSFDFGRTSNYDISLPATPNIVHVNDAQTLVTSVRQDLSCDTTYNYRVRAVNAVGTAYGENQSFKTLPCTPSTLAMLESPQANSFESGIGLIRGWACSAKKIEVQIDGKGRLPVVYGMPRNDTQEVCNDSNNGFAILFNWNLLTSGRHVLRAFADTWQFAEVTFNVTTLGVEFLRTNSYEYDLRNFPNVGDMVRLRWAEPHQNFVMVYAKPAVPSKNAPLIENLTVPTIKAGYEYPGVVESPAAASFESGLGLVRGWACGAKKIEVQIDNGPRLQAAYGMVREDTVTPCADNDNGFSLLMNWNTFSSGNHTMRVFGDDYKFAEFKFTVTNLNIEFLVGAAGAYSLPNFPSSGRSTNVRWSEPHQNFVIVP